MSAKDVYKCHFNAITLFTQGDQLVYDEKEHYEEFDSFEAMAAKVKGENREEGEPCYFLKKCEVEKVLEVKLISEEQTQYESQQLTDIELKALKYLIYESYLQFKGAEGYADQYSQLAIYRNIVLILARIYKAKTPQDVIIETDEEKQEIEKFVKRINKGFMDEGFMDKGFMDELLKEGSK